MNKLKTIGFLVLILLLSTIFLTHQSVLLVRGSTIRVPDDYSSIQDAINHASPGDIITVRAGVYNGFTVSKSLVILGESNQTVVIKGSVGINVNNVRIGTMRIVLDESSGSSVALKTTGNNTVLSGLVIESYKYGVQIGDAAHSVSGTVIEYSRINAERTGIFGVSEDLGVFYSKVVSNREVAIVGGHGLDLEFNTIIGDTGVSTSWGSKGYLIKNNAITGKSTGIFLDGKYHVVSNNSISGGTGIFLRGGGMTIENNTINVSGTGIYIASHNNIVVGNKISATGHAIDLNGNSNLIANNTLTGGRGVHGNGAYNNMIIFNLVNMTGSVGVYFSKYTGGNLVYGNTFWYCYNYEAADESGKNYWFLENATHKLGNYWSYNKAPDNDGDGITDSPYHIVTTLDLEILDKYPLAKPIVSPYQPPPTTTTQPPPTTWTMHTTTTQITIPSTEHLTSPATTQVIEGIDYYIPVLAVAIVLMLVAGLILLRLKRQ